MAANYKNLSALDPVAKLVAEAGKALDQPDRTLRQSDVPELLGAAGGIGAGAAAGWGILAAGAAANASGAAAMTSGLAAAGGIIGGGMMAGMAVIAAPAVILGVAGYGVLAKVNKRRLRERKELLLQEALRKNDAIVRMLKQEGSATRERAEYLSRLVILLRAAVENLQGDLHPA